jgi:methylated-DNA-[protein]-cysteine S-methyltransferase
MISTTTTASPVGELVLGASEQGVRFVLWPADRRRLDLGSDARTEAPAGADSADAQIARSRILAAAVSQVEEYFAGTRRVFDLPLDPVGTPFQRSAWGVLRTIPYAATMSYGEQARALGDPNKARAVGAANGRNPISIIVPCHRVVGSTGALTGFAGGIESKAWLLDHERRVVASG